MSDGKILLGDQVWTVRQLRCGNLICKNRASRGVHKTMVKCTAQCANDFWCTDVRTNAASRNSRTGFAKNCHPFGDLNWANSKWVFRVGSLDQKAIYVYLMSARQKDSCNMMYCKHTPIHGRRTCIAVMNKT